METNHPTESNTIAAEAESGIDEGRRGLGRLLALFGGGALLSACVPVTEDDPPATAAQFAAISSAETFDSLATLRAFNNNAAIPAPFAAVLGYAARGDGGGGIFTWTAGTTPSGVVDDDGIIVVSSAATSGYWTRLYSGPVDVRWYGAKGDGSGNDAPSIQRAIDSVGSGNRSSAGALSLQGYTTIYLPRGNYRITSTITVAHDRVHIRGEGVWCTQLTFDPTAGDGGVTPTAAFLFRRTGTAVLYQCSLRGLALSSPNTTGFKVAVDLLDVSRFDLCDIAVIDWRGSSSIGVRIQGRELSRVQRLSIQADRPMVVDRNVNTPGSSVDFDSFHLQDLALAVSSGSTRPSLEIAQGVTVYNLLLDGSNNMSGGLHGFYWDDSGSTAQSYNVVLRNLKCEQMAGSAAAAVGRSVHIAPAVVLRNLLLDNVMCATGPSDSAGYRNRGIYLKNVERAVLQSCLFLSMDTSTQNEGNLIEVASGGATQDVEWRACTFFQYAQVSMGSLELTGSGPRYGSTFLPSSAHYMVAFALKNTWRERDAFVNRITGEVSAASSTTIGIVGFEGGTAGTVTIVAYDASGTSTTNYSGLASFVRSGTSCTLARLGGTNFDVTGTPSLLLSWANPDFRITNYSGIALRFIVTFEFRA